MERQFFADAHEFLAEFDWIYRTANTECLAKGVLDRLPAEWVEYYAHDTVERLNALAVNEKHSASPISIRQSNDAEYNFRLLFPYYYS